MVRLNRIYTKTGDAGTTGLGDGTRVPKTDARIEAYGTVDELNSLLGLALLAAEGAEPDGLGELLAVLQNDLFDLGADLCVPPDEDEAPPGKDGARLRVTAAYVERLEGWIDEHNEDLEPLKSFVLPGGSPLAAWLHLARTVSRRCERGAFAVLEAEGPGAVGQPALQYLNRLSDLFFVLARRANDDGRADRLWAPGGGGQTS